MKLNTDFGVQEVKPQRIFEWQGIKFAIVKRQESYMNGKEPLIMQRVVEYNTTISLPIVIQRGDTLKKIEQRALQFLSRTSPEELTAKIKELEQFN